jgi:hypothetical protein
MADEKEAASWASKIQPAASKSWKQVKDVVGKDVELGARAKGFARVATVGAGAYYAAGVFKSKDADGNDRSALARLGNLVVGGGVAAAGVLAHRR